MKQLQVGILLTIVMALTACASWLKPYEQPDVNITSFSMAPASDGAPGFLIGLQVVNPNDRPLPVRGMTYQIDVDGHRIVSGAEPDLPAIAAYSSQEITIRATPDLLGSARLLNDFFSRQRESLNYTFKARLDINGLLPDITIEESGEFTFSQQP